MPTIKSTFNFVPAPEEGDVRKPKWSHLVSHDIPFSDGESGEIDITITAQTPIFIRNGHSEGSDEKEFSNIGKGQDKKYFIPATSLKGMVRNVLEIMSYSRIKSENDIFSFRDLNHPKYKNEVAQNSQLKTGWLFCENQKWVIEECQSVRIKMSEISTFFSIPGFKDMNAPEKYNSIGIEDLGHTFSHIRDLGRTNNRNNFIKTGELFGFDKAGSFNGKLVFYGAIDNKKYDYVFSTSSISKHDVPSILVEKFEAIDDKLENTQWQYFRKNGVQKIPVFFSSDKTKTVQHFGFSRLYKMSNTKYLTELQPLKSYLLNSENNELDLTETIFGVIDNSLKSPTLKGRVFFGNAFVSTPIVEPITPVTVVLSSPKASFHPFYLSDRATYLDEGASIRGFKKYPVHTYVKPSLLNEENQDIESVIKPLSKGTIFKSKIRFHNLREIEIGAILSALTFHGNNDKLCHSIGSGKPLGYGKISLEVNGVNFLDKKISDYLAAYENWMNQHKEDWVNSKSIIELFSIANTPKQENHLVYPQLELPNTPSRFSNEFNNYKREGQFLEPYSSINGVLKASSIIAKIELEKKLASGNISFNEDSLKKLKRQLKEDGITRVPDSLVDALQNALKKIYSHHRESRLKLNKKDFDTNYEWSSTITNWLGREQAYSLYLELVKSNS